jgi:single-stranded-DNA-specific exonuclease
MTITNSSRRTLTNKRWRYRSTGQGDQAVVQTLVQKLDVPALAARLLAVRGLVDPAAASAFLKPRLNDLHDPALLHDADRAAQRLAQAVRDGQPIVIYGDYDVDGVTASAVLWHILRAAGAKVFTYVPHRIDEGYGLNSEAISKLCQGVDEQMCDGHDSSSPMPTGQPLIVSVDCGITAIEPARVAREAGADLIITDHHEFDAAHLPHAFALVHPRLGDEPYPFADLCGAGVAFKVAWQFAKVWSGSERVSEGFKTLLLDLLSLVALGTVADVVPLVGENRVIATTGLGQIKRTRLAGLNAMIDAANLRDEKIDAYHVGFVLGPRLNACGRMGHARRAVRLLTTAGGDEAAEVAQFLTQENDKRRATEKTIFEQARAMVTESGYDSTERRAIVVGAENWHPGVVGIVASRLVEAFHRPAIVLCYGQPRGEQTQADDNNEAAPATEAHGSARSVEGVSIHEALHGCADLLTSFGGHAMAAGMRLPVERVDELRQRLITLVNAQLSAEQLTGVVEIDTLCELSELTLPVVRQLDRLAPFGRSNPAPVLAASGVVLDQPAQRLGKQGQHMKLFLRQGQRLMTAVWWKQGDLVESLATGCRMDVVFEVKLSTWNGAERVELTLLDAKLSG